MFSAFKYRIFPSEPQKELIAKHIGSSRFVYNLALETKNAAYIGSKHNYSAFDLDKQLPELKKELPWLKEVNSQSLQQSIHNMDIAFKKFFKGAGFPKFKSKRDRQSFSIPQNVIVENDLLIIPKFKEGIKIKLHRPTKGTIKSATISVTPTGKYFVSILCETGEAIKPKAKVKEKTTVGIDLGIKTYLVSSDGQEFDNPKFLRKAQIRLKYVQRKYSKHKGKRTKQRLAILHEKVTNQRKDFLHKTSSELIKNHDSLAIEDLAVSNMVKNHNLAQAISDASWSTFVTMLEYKAEWYGKNILKIGRFEPSSKLHANCGYINKDLKLSDREWFCPKCGELVSRDVNAAINIKSFALKKILSGTDRKNQGKLSTMVEVMTLEAQPIAFGVGA